MKERIIAVSLAAVSAVLAAAPMEVSAASSSSTEFELRKKVIGISGIMDITGIYQPVTRAQFAQMLVNASEYRIFQPSGKEPRGKLSPMCPRTICTLPTSGSPPPKSG